MTKRFTFTKFCTLMYKAQEPKSLGGILWFCWFVVPYYFRYLDWKSKHEAH